MTRFDTIVWSTATGLILLIGFVVFQGAQIGLAIIAMSPARDAAAVATQAHIRIEFDDTLTDVPKSAVSITPPISGTTTIIDNTLVFEPATRFDPEQTYTVSLVAGIRGERGRTLKEPLTWQFRTTHPRVLFIKPDENGPDQIYMVNPFDGSSPRQLTSNEGSILQYAVSPDSSQIAYAAFIDDLGQTGAANIWLINADGSHPTKLLDCPEAACSNPVWLPDGRRIIYEKRNIPVPGGAPANPRLYWLDVGTGETVPMFNDSQQLGLLVSISPTGDWFSFVSPIDHGIQFYNLEDGSGLLMPNRMGLPVAWRPDGQEIAFADIITNEQDWSVAISKLNLVTRETQMLTSGIEADDNYPVWSPDGQQIAYGHKPARTAIGRQIWVMNADGSNATPLTNDEAIIHSEFRWSIDGRFILYQRLNQEELYSQPSVWLLDLVNGTTREIASPAVQSAWLP